MLLTVEKPGALLYKNRQHAGVALYSYLLENWTFGGHYYANLVTPPLACYFCRLITNNMRPKQ